MKTEIAHSIQPFNISIADVVLIDLKRRLSNIRWMNPIESKGWEYRIDPAYLKEFIFYCKDTFDWRVQEENLNQFQHYTSDLEDYNLHFSMKKEMPGLHPNTVAAWLAGFILSLQ